MIIYWNLLIKSRTDNAFGNVFFLIYLTYWMPDIFVLTFFGNETFAFSYELSYALFESKWIEQINADKKLLIIRGGILKQLHLIIIGKLYPLTLEMF